MQVYLVGGAVRDTLLKRPVKERDYVVVGATPEQLIALGYQQVGNDFPVFLHPQSKDEYALARTERKQGQGYTGFICDFSPSISLEEDLIRRDLTINAMAFDDNSTLIDPYNGQQDLHDKLLRHVSDAFCEDPLRILRVARFAARYHYLDFKIAPETLALMTSMVARGEINTLTKERVWKEIEKSLEDGAIYIFCDVLSQIGALAHVVPSLEKNWHQHASDALKQQIAALDAQSESFQIAQFCLWLKTLNPEQVVALTSHLRLPKRYSDALVLFNEFHNQLLTRLDKEIILQLFNSADLWRRQERLSIFLDTFSVLSTKANQIAEKIRSIALHVAAIDVQEIIKQGFKGAEIKNQLDKRRQQIIADSL